MYMCMAAIITSKWKSRITRRTNIFVNNDSSIIL